MEIGHRATLLERLSEEGYVIDLDPAGNGMCFYAAVAHQLGISPIQIRDMLFDYLLKHRYNVCMQFVHGSECARVLFFLCVCVGVRGVPPIIQVYLLHGHA